MYAMLQSLGDSSSLDFPVKLNRGSLEFLCDEERWRIPVLGNGQVDGTLAERAHRSSPFRYS